MKRRGGLRYSLLGVDFDGLDALAAAKKIVALAREGRFSYIVTPIVDHLVQLDRSNDPAMALAYRDAALCLCDRRNLARLARWLGIDLLVVQGSDVQIDSLLAALPSATLDVVRGDAGNHGTLRGVARWA